MELDIQTMYDKSAQYLGDDVLDLNAITFKFIQYFMTYTQNLPAEVISPVYTICEFDTDSSCNDSKPIKHTYVMYRYYVKGTYNKHRNTYILDNDEILEIINSVKNDYYKLAKTNKLIVDVNFNMNVRLVFR